MLTLHLTTWERVMLTTIIGSLEGGRLDLIYKASKILNTLDLTEDERAKIGFVRTGKTLRWNNDHIEWDLEFDDPEALSLIQLAVKAHANYRVADRIKIMALMEKLGVGE